MHRVLVGQSGIRTGPSRSEPGNHKLASILSVSGKGSRPQGFGDLFMSAFRQKRGRTVDFVLYVVLMASTVIIATMGIAVTLIIVTTTSITTATIVVTVTVFAMKTVVVVPAVFALTTVVVITAIPSHASVIIGALKIFKWRIIFIAPMENYLSLVAAGLFTIFYFCNVGMGNICAVRRLQTSLFPTIAFIVASTTIMQQRRWLIIGATARARR